MCLIQAHSAVIFQPILGDFRNYPDRSLCIRQMDQYVLHQHQVRMNARKQKGSSGIHFPIELGVKGINMCIEISIQSSDRKVVALHFVSDRKVAHRILLNVSEVSHRSTTGSKKRVVIGIVTTHQCDDFPFLVIKSHLPNVKAGTDGCLAACIPCNSTFNINDFSGTHVLWESLHTPQVSDAYFPKNGHSYRIQKLDLAEP